MALPFATTSISVLRFTEVGVSGDIDGWPDTEPTYPAVQTDVRAVISSPGGTFVQAGSIQEDLGLMLATDPCDLRHSDRVLDQTDGTVYAIKWVRACHGFNLEHNRAGIRLVEGWTS